MGFRYVIWLADVRVKRRVDFLVSGIRLGIGCSESWELVFRKFYV